MEACLAKTCLSAACTAEPTSFVFHQLIQTLLLSQCALMDTQLYPPDRTDEIIRDSLDFDFIIAGSGSAGSVVASRLSEVPHWRILLIESGKDPSPLSNIPLMNLALHNTEEDYKFIAEPDERFCQGTTDKRCHWTKGKALGGSSVVNAMLWIRGNQQDYDGWAALGNEGWSYEKLLPYFRKIENYHPEVVEKYGNELFGVGGPLSIRSSNYTQISGFYSVIQNAAKEINIPVLDILNGEQSIGYGISHGTLSDGIRQNVARAYLAPVKDRKNLFVMKSARVDRVIVENKRARGVKVTLATGVSVDLFASKEVILSAGSINTPQILMLSGIGPKPELEKHNIDVVVDLLVGRNLQDHVSWPGLLLTFRNKTILPPSPTILLDWSYQYLLHRNGEFSATNGLDFHAFLNTKDASANFPNIQFHHVHLTQYHSFKIDTFANAFNWKSSIVKQLKDANMMFDIVFVSPTLLNPESIGHLELKSADPKDQLRIFANYFDKKEDVKVLLESVDIVRSLVSTNASRNLGVQLLGLNIEGCPEFDPASNEYWECSLRNLAGTIFHPCGTCKMGPKSNDDSVVDNTLKVHHIQGLRVIDASIMPKIPSGNTNAPTIMIGEKGADLIKTEWNVKSEL